MIFCEEPIDLVARALLEEGQGRPDEEGEGREHEEEYAADNASEDSNVHGQKGYAFPPGKASRGAAFQGRAVGSGSSRVARMRRVAAPSVTTAGSSKRTSSTKQTEGSSFSQ